MTATTTIAECRAADPFAIAARFILNVEQAVGDQFRMSKVRTGSKAPCDYCDGNQAMIDAIEAYIGDYPMLCEAEESGDAEQLLVAQYVNNLSEVAWDIASRLRFDPSAAQRHIGASHLDDGEGEAVEHYLPFPEVPVVFPGVAFR